MTKEILGGKYTMISKRGVYRYVDSRTGEIFSPIEFHNGQTVLMDITLVELHKKAQERNKWSYNIAYGHKQSNKFKKY